MRRFLLPCLALLSTGMIASSAWADTAMVDPVSVSAFLNTVDPTATVNINFLNTGWTSTPFVGQINWTQLSVSNTVGSTSDQSFLNDKLNQDGNGNFFTFCIEGTQDVYIQQTSTWGELTDLSQAPWGTPGSHPMGSTASGVLQEFWGRHIGDVTHNKDQWGNTTSESDTTAAAFQLAVWEIVYDTATDYNPTAKNFTPHFNEGGFQANGNDAALNLATSWLTNFATGIGGTSGYTPYTVSALRDPSIQDQAFGYVLDPNLTQSGGLGGSAVPLPAALPMGLFGLGLLGAAAFLRRRALAAQTI